MRDGKIEMVMESRHETGLSALHDADGADALRGFPTRALNQCFQRDSWLCGLKDRGSLHCPDDRDVNGFSRWLILPSDSRASGLYRWLADGLSVEVASRLPHPKLRAR